MKLSYLLAMTFIIFGSCASNEKKLIKIKEGGLIESKKSFKESSMPARYEVSLQALQNGKNEYLAVKVMRNDPIREEWQDVYAKIGVYENSDGSWVKEASGTMTKDMTSVRPSLSSIKASSLKLLIEGRQITSDKKEGDSFLFKLGSKGINPSETKAYDTQLSVDESSIDVSNEFSEFVAKYRSEKNWPENKYNKKFCKQPDLFNAIYDPFQGRVESDCLYVLRGPLKIIQATNGGVLIGLIELSSHIQNKIFFLKTKKSFVDDDIISPMFVHSSGALNYNTVLGASRTVHSFQYLGEAKLIRLNNFNEDYRLDPNQD